jgi:integrase
VWRTKYVQDTKTAASNAPVPLVKPLAEQLEIHRNGSAPEGFIFTGQKLGRPLDFHNLAYRVISPILEEAGIPWRGWHAFRRGLATNLNALGVRTKDGASHHASFTTEHDDRYLHEGRFSRRTEGYEETRQGLQSRLMIVGYVWDTKVR